MKEIIEKFNKSEEITDEMITSASNRCIEKNFEPDSIIHLKELAANCETKTDYLNFFKNELKLDVEESERGIILHLHKTECTCPMAPELTIDKRNLCNCTKAREKYVWGQVLDREIDVQIVESFWRGGTDCVIEILL